MLFRLMPFIQGSITNIGTRLQRGVSRLEFVTHCFFAYFYGFPCPFYVVIQIFGALFFDNFLFHFAINLFTTN